MFRLRITIFALLVISAGWAAGRATAAEAGALTLTAEEAYQQAGDAERKKSADCVDLYAWAALQSWPAMAAPASDSAREQAVRVYQDSLEKMLSAALKYKRLDPQKGLDLRVRGGGDARIVVSRNGFAWQAEDFNDLQTASDIGQGKLKRYWREDGLGVPLVALRLRNSERDPYGKWMPFAATAVLRPDARTSLAAGNWPPGTVIGVLDLYDPLRVTDIDVGPSSCRLARDTSAPLALVLRDVNRDNFQDFMHPGRPDGNSGLRMLEPYQPGRVPVVLVHGLLSDKFTWIPLVNDLRSVPWVNSRCQIWTFQYPTGQPFLQSAATMRQALRDMAGVYDPQNRDPAQQQVVLIGHSMGGLVSKLQITYSGNALWDRVATRPFSELRADPQQRDAIAKMFFFDPLPSVKRVVFLGTPHLGSFWAQSLYGRFGSSLVRMPRDSDDLIASLSKSNPKMFNSTLRNGIPTSIDLLKPDSPLLLGMQQLSINPSVKIHTIAGNGVPFSDGTPADGVVALESARHPGAVSERFINAGHNDLPDNPETTAEILRILTEHLQQIDATYRVARP